MVVNKTKVAFKVNEEELGVAFDDENINSKIVTPYIWIHEKETSVEVVPGTLQKGQTSFDPKSEAPPEKGAFKPVTVQVSRNEGCSSCILF